MDIHYNDPNQFLICRKCKVDEYISHYRFKHFICRVCLYLKKYRFGRFGHTKERLIEQVKKYNNEVYS